MAEKFEKGMRVRVVAGEHEGVVGEIFWWGRSKFGPELRAGVLSEEDEEKVWVEALELRAIDEEGNELDPQPSMTVSSGPAKSTPAIRGVEVPFAFARALTAERLSRGIPPAKADSAKVRMDFLHDAQQKLGCQIPDPIVAYIASSLGATREISAVVGLTADLLDALGDERGVEDAEQIAFENDNGNYLVFERGAPKDSLEYQLLDHEASFEDGPAGNLQERVVAWLGDDPKTTTPPFEVVIDYVSQEESEPDEPDETWVTHKKFGRGIVTDIVPSKKGDKLTVEFEDGETRKLLDRFVQFD